MTLRAAGELFPQARGPGGRRLEVSERTVWRWVRQATQTPERVGLPGARPRFEIDSQVRTRLAYWRGNVAAVHRELLAAAAQGGPVAPGRSTLYRAVARALSPGDRAGLRKGERARREFDVFLSRPATYHNAVWEADHVQAPVEVDVAGQLVKPWVTWFVDVSTNVVTGLAVSPGPASRESILAALRSAISLEAPYGPAGGLPERVRVDRGKDFLSRTITAALGVFAVGVEDLPGYTPHLKGTVESLNGAAETMFFAQLPRYVHAPTLANGQVADADAPALRYEAFVAELLAWVRWWNTQHQMLALDDRTPLEAWLADPTPLVSVPAGDLHLFTLEDDGRERRITTKGVSWAGRSYVGEWMTGHVGRRVRLRYMPHHEHEVEVFDARTAEHLGAAVLSDQASPEMVAAVRRERARQARRLAADLKAAEKARRAVRGLDGGRAGPGGAGDDPRPGPAQLGPPRAGRPAAPGPPGVVAAGPAGTGMGPAPHQLGRAGRCGGPGRLAMTSASTGERADHYLGLSEARIVATEALLELRDNLTDVMDAKAMMCVHGDAGVGKTLSVNAALRALPPLSRCAGCSSGPARPPATSGTCCSRSCSCRGPHPRAPPSSTPC
jgi:putative transposase